jgi:hypothetical protein
MNEPSTISYRVRGGDEREYAAADAATLERWAREARLTKATLVWSSADGQWREAGERRELDAAFAAWNAPHAPPVVGPPVNTQAIWCFVLAQFGLCCCLPAIPAIVCGFLALSQIRRQRERGRVLAVSGIILGFAGLALGVLFVIYCWLVGNMDPSERQQLIETYLRWLQALQAR